MQKCNVVLYSFLANNKKKQLTIITVTNIYNFYLIPLLIVGALVSLLGMGSDKKYIYL